MDLFKVNNNFEIINQTPVISIFENKLFGKVKYTIAIPTFKRAEFLRATLESALQQDTNIPYEIIVVDNNPERSDCTEKLMLEYQARKGLSYYKNKKNIGMIGNWNKLFTLANTDWVIILHDDDMISCEYIAIVDSILNNYDNIGILQTGKTKDKNNILKINPATKTKVNRLHLRDFVLFFKGGAPTGTTFNREKTISLGGFNPAFFPSSDYSFFALMAANYTILYTPEKLTYYRWSINESQKVEIRREMIKRDIIIQQRIIQELNFRPKWLYKRLLSAMISVRNQRGIQRNPEFQSIDCSEFNLSPSNLFWDFLYRISIRVIK